jgi:hypothetical protein
MHNFSILQLVSCCTTLLDIVGLVPVSHNRDFRFCRVDAYEEGSAFRESFEKSRAYATERGLFMQACI